MTPLNFRQLSAFNAVMKAGSVTEAAERLFVTQPAVTKLLKGFEESCGLSLFERGQGRLKPTAEARQLFAETEKLESGMMRISRLAESIRNLERGEVSAVTFPALSMHIAPQAAAVLLKRSPDVLVQLFSRTSRSIEDSMITGRADFGIGLRPSTAPSLIAEEFEDLHFVAALPAHHPLAVKDHVSIMDLDGERFIALGRDDLSYPLTEAAFQRVGARMNAVAEVHMADAACAMVAAGAGVAIVLSITHAGTEDDRLAFRPLREPFGMKSWLMTPRGEPMSLLATSLLDEIRHQIRQLQFHAKG
ncbi:LysR substrate-binding domain-containing protein [Aurantimonas sp. VKM B-3413]|uniref:LysR substrate-binding domain-containing protein n=1 Tax=Aurantimonas sp. VKM B-3413 TaxID=2779401 RepID=UPI001E402023|nr:LysR substrate-binding domain-containing protein [Aurantimonas sp. VKM B-3413]MCB8840373.1 LysR family transcriptional regulator [Aurantimonas sp. VKM B-3413]